MWLSAKWIDTEGWYFGLCPYFLKGEDLELCEPFYYFSGFESELKVTENIKSEKNSYGYECSRKELIETLRETLHRKAKLIYIIIGS